MAIASGRASRVLVRPLFHVISFPVTFTHSQHGLLGRAQSGNETRLRMHSRTCAVATHDCIPESDEPHQPVNFETFFGQKKAVLRSFRSSWFSQWPFLHYNEMKDAAFCHTCLMAFNPIRMKANSTVDPAFK